VELDGRHGNGDCIVETLVARGGVDQDELARRFAARYVAEPGRGYGGRRTRRSA
jgi:hypothetical protein